MGQNKRFKADNQTIDKTMVKPKEVVRHWGLEMDIVLETFCREQEDR